MRGTPSHRRPGCRPRRRRPDARRALGPQACADPRGELVPTLCAHPDDAFKNDCFTEQRQKKQGKKTNTEPVRTADPYDPDWHLTAETLWLHGQKWSDPPGSRWVTYTRPRNCFEIKPAPAKARASRRPAACDDGPLHIARFALDSSVLPLITHTLPVAEASRRALMSIFGRLTETNGNRGRSPNFAGKDHLGTPLRGHRHAYFLPTDEDADGHLDHLTVYASGGFSSDEIRALERLQRITSNSPHPLRAVLLHTSSLTHATAERTDPRAPSSRSPLAQSPLASSAVWASATPYLVTRHPKTRGPHRVDLADPAARLRFLQDDLIAQLNSARPDLGGLITRATITPIIDEHRRYIIRPATGAPRILHPLQFKRFRRKPTDDGGRRLAAAFTITFPSPVRGPIALGHSSHFGMGLFLPAPTRH